MPSAPSEQRLRSFYAAVQSGHTGANQAAKTLKQKADRGDARSKAIWQKLMGIHWQSKGGGTAMAGAPKMPRQAFSGGPGAPRYGAYGLPSLNTAGVMFGIGANVLSQTRIQQYLTLIAQARASQPGGPAIQSMTPAPAQTVTSVNPMAAQSAAPAQQAAAPGGGVLSNPGSQWYPGKGAAKPAAPPPPPPPPNPFLNSAAHLSAASIHKIPL